MEPNVLPAASAELAAAYLQLAVTLGLVALCSILNRRYRRRYFGLWAVAWARLARVTATRTKAKIRPATVDAAIRTARTRLMKMA